MPEESKRHLKVFLCYASVDKPKARELYHYLLRRRIKPWFDEVDLVGGQDWQVEIPKALATSDAILICLTKNSVDKEGYIQKEIKYALEKALEMPDGRIFLIPVRFEECNVPFSLSRYQWVDLFDEVGYARMMKALKFRASQLKREAVELPKTTEGVEKENVVFEKEEQNAIEKAVREKIESESTGKAKHEGAEPETAEKAKLQPPEKKPSIEIACLLILIMLLGSAICGLTTIYLKGKPIFKPTFTETFASTFTIGYTPVPDIQNKPTHPITPPSVTTSSLIITFMPTALPTTSAPFTPTETVVPQPGSNTSILSPAATSTPRLIRTPPSLTSTYTPTDIILPPTNIFAPTATITSTSSALSIIQSFLAPGSYAEGITWDGASLWVTDNSATVFKLDTSGNVLDSFTAPEGTPQGLTWDGSSLWIYTTSRNRIYQVQYNGVQTQIISNFNSPADVVGGGITNDMAWDGNNLWFANQYKVYHLTTTGVQLGHFTFPRNVLGMDWDGTNLWLAYYNASGSMTLSKVDVTGKVLVSYPSPVPEIDGLVWVNGYLWALYVNYINSSSTIYQLAIP